MDQVLFFELYTLDLIHSSHSPKGQMLLSPLLKEKETEIQNNSAKVGG